MWHPDGSFDGALGSATDIEWVYQFRTQGGKIIEETYQGVEHETKFSLVHARVGVIRSSPWPQITTTSQTWRALLSGLPLCPFALVLKNQHERASWICIRKPIG